MHPDSFFRKEILEDLRNRRGLLLKFVLPAGLLLPLILADLPVSLQAAGITVAIIFSGIFGSSIGLVRIRESGMLDRMAMLPISPRRLIAGYIFANALLDGAQVAVPLAVFLLIHPPPRGRSVRPPWLRQTPPASWRSPARQRGHSRYHHGGRIVLSGLVAPPTRGPPVLRHAALITPRVFALSGAGHPRFRARGHRGCSTDRGSSGGSRGQPKPPQPPG